MYGLGFYGKSPFGEQSTPSAQPEVAQKNIWRQFPTGRITGSAFIPWSNAEVIADDFFEALPSEGAAISFTMPQMGVAVAASKTVPVIAATVSFAMPQMSVAVAASNAAAGVSASVAFTMPQMTVSVSASKAVPTYSASVAFSMPQMGVAVSASKTVPVRAATVSFAMPQMQVAATASQESTNRSASIAFSMPQMQVISYARSFALAAEADASFRFILQDDANVFGGMLEIGAESIRFMIPDADVYSGTIGGDASFNCIIATTAVNYIGAIQ